MYKQQEKNCLEYFSFKIAIKHENQKLTKLGDFHANQTSMCLDPQLN